MCIPSLTITAYCTSEYGHFRLQKYICPFWSFHTQNKSYAYMKSITISTWSPIIDLKKCSSVKSGVLILKQYCRWSCANIVKYHTPFLSRERYFFQVTSKRVASESCVSEIQILTNRNFSNFCRAGFGIRKELYCMGTHQGHCSQSLNKSLMRKSQVSSQ